MSINQKTIPAPPTPRASTPQGPGACYPTWLFSSRGELHGHQDPLGFDRGNNHNKRAGIDILCADLRGLTQQNDPGWGDRRTDRRRAHSSAHPDPRDPYPRRPWQSEETYSSLNASVTPPSHLSHFSFLKTLPQPSKLSLGLTFSKSSQPD